MFIEKTIQRKMSIELFRNFRDFIYEKSGLFFPENKLYLLEDRLGHRLVALGHKSFQEYFNYLKRLPSQSEELSKIYNLITINETYFFRYPAQLEVFKRTLLPATLHEKSQASNKRLKIWSAASSSGEELFTIAFMVKDILGTSINDWNLELKGTDISRQILEQAKLARYGRNSFRGSSNSSHKAKYFDTVGDSFCIKSDIREMVSFDYLNLNDVPEIRKHRGLDYIFCRNVLIYFDKEMKKKVIQAFYNVLNPGGYLLLGEAESLHGISSEFQVEHFPGAFVYQKA